MARDVSNTVLIPADLPNRPQIERILRDEGLQPQTYADPAEAAKALDATPATAILLAGAADPSGQVSLIKKIRTVAPETLIMGLRGEDAATEPHAAPTGGLLTEARSPEEFAVAIRMARAFRGAQAAADELRAQIDLLERRTRDQSQQILDLHGACDALRERAHSAEEMALHDPLTGLYNRRYFESTVESELERARREKGRFAIALIDIDHFKKCNDEHGHVVGDRVLQEFGQAIVRSLRRMDTVARYGGEEFIVLLPRTQISSRTIFDAATLVERVRKTIDATVFQEDEAEGGIHITLSAGVVQYPGDGETVEELTAEADRRLYAAKTSGRNRICASSP